MEKLFFFFLGRIKHFKMIKVILCKATSVATQIEEC